MTLPHDIHAPNLPRGYAIGATNSSTQTLAHSAMFANLDVPAYVDTLKNNLDTTCAALNTQSAGSGCVSTNPVQNYTKINFTFPWSCNVVSYSYDKQLYLTYCTKTGKSMSACDAAGKVGSTDHAGMCEISKVLFLGEQTAQTNYPITCSEQ